MLLRREAQFDESDNHIDMTPMVDVVFQLMTFMLFAMRVTSAQGVEIPEAKNGVGVEETVAIVLTLAPDPDGGPAIVSIGEGKAKGGAAASATPEQVKAAILEGKAQGRNKIVIQADGEVAYGDVLALAADAGSSGDVSIHIGVKEKE